MTETGPDGYPFAGVATAIEMSAGATAIGSSRVALFDSPDGPSLMLLPMSTRTPIRTDEAV